MCCYDSEGPTLLEEKYITARKLHTCCECGSEISPGEKYQRTKGLWGGSWDTFKTCETCARIRDNAFTVVDCIVYGQLYECVGYDFEEGKA